MLIWTCDLFELESQTDTPYQAQIIISLEMVRIGIMVLHAHPQVIYVNCVKSHRHQFIRYGGVALTRHLDRQMDEQGDS